ncbi:MAG: hypothetical protein ABFD69_14250 [Candidatus Sumerlaeia bacterium]
MHKLIYIMVFALSVGCGQATNSSNQDSHTATPTPTPAETESPAVTGDTATSTMESSDSLVITPLVGVGAIKFGMSTDQVIEVLGQPERMTVPMHLEYMSKGIAIMAPGDSPDTYAVSGLMFSDLFIPESSPDKVCKYKTADGIGTGSTLEDLQKAFGKPSRVQKVGPRLQVDYEAIGASFMLEKNRVIHMSFMGTRRK